MRNANDDSAQEQVVFIASQVAGFTNDKALFIKFLEEVSNPKVLLEQSPEEAFGIVQIMVKAGLQLLKNETKQHDGFEKLFASSVAAIKFVIAEHPTILVQKVHSGTVDGPDQLWSWLFNTFRELLRGNTSEMLAESICAVFCAILSGLRGQISKYDTFSRCVHEVCNTARMDIMSAIAKPVLNHAIIQNMRILTCLLVELASDERLEALAVNHVILRTILADFYALSSTPKIQTLIPQYSKVLLTLSYRVLMNSNILVAPDTWLKLADFALHSTMDILLDTPMLERHSNLRISAIEVENKLCDEWQRSFISVLQVVIAGSGQRENLQRQLLEWIRVAQDHQAQPSPFKQQLADLLHRTDECHVRAPQEFLEIAPIFKKPLVNEPVQHVLDLAISKIYKDLAGSPDALNLVESKINEFDNITVEERRSTLQALNLLVCASTTDLRCGDQASLNGYVCLKCDFRTSGAIVPCLKIPYVNMVKLCVLVIRNEHLRTDSKLRFMALDSIRRLLNHSTIASELDLSTSPFIKYVNAYLGDESCQVRYCAGYNKSTNAETLTDCSSQVLIAHFRYAEREAEEVILQANRRRVFDILRSHAANPKLAESSIRAWADLGLISCPEDLLLILITLVDYLCHSNILVRQRAIVAIYRLSSGSKCSNYMLFSPYMRHISRQILDRSEKQPDLINKFSAILGKFCGTYRQVIDISGITTADFFSRNQHYLLPAMVLHGMHNQIRAIGESTRRTINQVMLDNMPYILSHLLISGYNKDGGLMRFLISADAAFTAVTIEELVNSYPIPLAAELLLLATEPSIKRETLMAALSQVGHICIKNTSSTRKTPRDMAQENLRLFLKKHSLGIVSQCEESINGFRGRRGVLDRSKYNRAIGELIMLLGPDIEHAVPQITACLQTSMEEPGLRYHALNAWADLIDAVSEEVVGPLIPYSICLFQHIWEDSTDRDRLVVHNVVESFLNDHQIVLAKQIGMVPRLRFAAMSDLEERLAVFRTSSSGIIRLRYMNNLCHSDNPVICEEGLHEMKSVLLLREHEIQNIILRDYKDPIIHETLRTLLDITLKFKANHSHIQTLASECLGIIGAIDPVRQDAAKKVSREVFLHNFEDEDAEESVKFVRIFLESQLINAFRSATRSNVQIFLAWAIQELLKFSGFDESLIRNIEDRNSLHDVEARKRWKMFSATAREVMAPLLSSKYDAGERMTKLDVKYPIITTAENYNSWLFLFLYDLLRSAIGENAKKLFGVFARTLREEETIISNFLLPYVFLNVWVGCTEEKRNILLQEINTILTPVTLNDAFHAEYIRLARASIFHIVDYLSLWSRARKIWNRDRLAERMKKQNKHMFPEDEEEKDHGIQRVQWLINKIPSKLMAEAALSCSAYSRALFYWEQHIRMESTTKKKSDGNLEPLFAQLQELYMNINDPDGIEGVSSCLSSLTLEQEIMMHENAGRWTSAQSIYELALQAEPDRHKYQVGLLDCLRESGHHELAVSQAWKFLHKDKSAVQALVDRALESSWSAGLWEDTAKLLRVNFEDSYSSLLGQTLLHLRKKEYSSYQIAVQQLRTKVMNELASSNLDSIWQCYDSLSKLAVVHEVDQFVRQHSKDGTQPTSPAILRNRLLMMPTTSRWKQHILAVRRALVETQFSTDIARLSSAIWLESAKLARKAGQSQQSYKAILNALKLNGTPLARIEHARWWWKEGHQMRAIQTLKRALDSKVFAGYEPNESEVMLSIDTTLNASGKSPKAALISKAELLLTRWNDLAEHANSKQQLREYVNASRGSQLEKPHYFMGRYYLRLLEAETKKSPEHQDLEFLQGEYHRQVVMSYGRAMHFGVKYVFQTLPSYLQLWLDFGNEVKNVPTKAAATGQRRQELAHMRSSHLANMNEKIKGFLTRLPTYLYMLAFPQILSRINHNEKTCYVLLENMILKCLVDYPKQSLWSFMAVCKSRDPLRASRGNSLIARLRAEAKKNNNSNTVRLSQDAQNLTDQLMHLCTVPVIKNRATLSLSRDLEFNVNVAPTNLVVPVQDNLTVILPAHGGVGSTKHHRAYEESQATIASFKDEVDVMASLQKPRKVTIRASDGQHYPFLVKPNDDLRKDARLMDFNGVIQKFIRRDPEALKRQMKIRTYAVIALNEDHGLCEWVRNTRPLRDILVKTYAGRGISMQYGEVKTRLEQCLASSNPAQAFETHILKMFSPSFHDWFVEKFADPSQWFAARMSYSRTLAVMSMVGFVLGLGDRHGENILFDETTGDAVHVDFNCLFEKGHTFDKPERVPFRLTHNMVDALGVTGVEGAFRKTCEITLRILRTNQDAFNTVLESFLHDPVGEFLKKIKKSPTGEFEKAEAIKVLSVIANKLKGSAGAGIADKHIPLSIEGQANELIKQATDPKLLVQMYIGWTAWL